MYADWNRPCWFWALLARSAQNAAYRRTSTHIDGGERRFASPENLLQIAGFWRRTRQMTGLIAMQKVVGSNPISNCIWIQLFANSLNETGRAGVVMANSASDARHSEADIRRKLIEEEDVRIPVELQRRSPLDDHTVTASATS